MTERHDPFAALRQPNFLLFSGSRLCSVMASQMFSATVYWQVYEVSKSAGMLAVVGLIRFVPSLGLSLLAGAVADSYDRRRLAVIAQCVQLLALAGVAVVAIAGSDSLVPVFAAVFAVSLASAFEWPARAALLPLLVRTETFPNAIIVSGTIQQAAFVTGPAIAGGLIAWSGAGFAYATLATLMAASIVLLTLLRPRSGEAPRRAVSVSAVMEGVRFVWHRQPVLGSMTLDMFAVIFGGAAALLPIYANDILDVGPVGYGLLFGAIDTGALLMSIGLVFFPPVQRVGRALLFAVLGFGVAVIVFGLSRSFPLSLVALFFVGASDQVSVVMRQTTIQLATPDDLRGRVTSVNMLFIGASNQLGAVESGVVAWLTSATFAVVSGGAGCLAVLGIVAAKMPELRAYRLGARPAAIEATPGEQQQEPVTVAGG